MRTEKEKEMERIKEATGATIRPEDFAYEPCSMHLILVHHQKKVQ